MGIDDNDITAAGGEYPEGHKKAGDEFHLKKDAYSELIKNAPKYISLQQDALIARGEKDSAKLLDKLDITRTQIKHAWEDYKIWRDSDEERAKSLRNAAYDAKMLPFMYWLRDQVNTNLVGSLK
jgi:hypothetical protein